MRNKTITMCLILLICFETFNPLLLASNLNAKDLKQFSENHRIVSIGGSVTETVFELGLGNLVVAVDISSTLPYHVKDLPQVGYIRKISSEGVLSMMPTKILTTSEIGPPNAVKQIQGSEVDVKIYNSPKTIEEITSLINAISNEFNVRSKAKKINDEIYSVIDSIKNISSTFKRAPRIAFFLNPSSGSFNAAGQGTNADYLIKLIGGINVFSSDFKKYQKVSKEQILQYNPDILIVSTHFPNQNASIHFQNNKEFIYLKALETDNLIEVSISSLSMGPSFASGVLSILKRINIDF